MPGTFTVRVVVVMPAAAATAAALAAPPDCNVPPVSVELAVVVVSFVIAPAVSTAHPSSVAGIAEPTPAAVNCVGRVSAAMFGFDSGCSA